MLEKKYELSSATSARLLIVSDTKDLIHKLEVAGVAEEALSWFRNYLSDRRQRVVLPGASSDLAYIRAGVPQGSILGPLLFLVYINDIVEDIDSHIRLFADDISLFIIVDDPKASAARLNIDLDKISRWAITWLVTLTILKANPFLYPVHLTARCIHIYTCKVSK